MAGLSAQAFDTAPDKNALRQKYLTQLRQVIETCFSEGELRTFCNDLGVDYDALPGRGKAEKANELVGYMERRGCTHELVELGKRLRPRAAWDYMPPEQMLARMKSASGPTDGFPSVRAGELNLDGAMAAIASLHDKWPTADLTAIRDWLATIKEQLNKADQASDQLTTRLQRWIDRYRKAWRIAQDCVYFQSWLSLRMDQAGKENWPALALEINLVFSPIRSDYASYMREIEGTRLLTPKEAEIVQTLGRSREAIERIEASRSVLRKARQDTVCAQELEQIRDDVEELSNCSIQLCHCLHTAIKEMVNRMNDPIKALKQL
jgi:hypothetical protein